MTDPAPVLRREIDALIQTQTTTLEQAKSLGDLELADFSARSEKIRGLFEMMGLRKPLSQEPARKGNIAYPYPSV